MTTHTQAATHPSQPATSTRGLLARYQALYKQTEGQGSLRRVPHPADIVYWLGCVGAISALLYVAMR